MHISGESLEREREKERMLLVVIGVFTEVHQPDIIIYVWGPTYYFAIQTCDWERNREEREREPERKNRQRRVGGRYKYRRGR